jgi:hypothetical protein
VVAEHSDKEPARGPDDPPRRDVYIDDLAVLIDGPVHVTPPSGNLDVVSSTNQWSPTAWRHGRAASAKSGVKRCTPPKRRDVIDLDPALSWPRSSGSVKASRTLVSCRFSAT